MPHRLLALVTALALLIASTGSAVLAQVETSIATPAASPLAAPIADLTGVEPLPLVGDRRAEFEACVAAQLAELEVPGASVAVVQGGRSSTSRALASDGTAARSRSGRTR